MAPTVGATTAGATRLPTSTNSQAFARVDKLPVSLTPARRIPSFFRESKVRDTQVDGKGRRFVPPLLSETLPFFLMRRATACPRSTARTPVGFHGMETVACEDSCPAVLSDGPRTLLNAKRATPQDGAVLVWRNQKCRLHMNREELQLPQQPVRARGWACEDSSELSSFNGSLVPADVRRLTCECFFLVVRRWLYKTADRILGCQSWETWAEAVLLW